MAAASWRRLGLLLLAYVGLISALSWFEGRIKVFSGGLGVPDLWQGFTAPALYERHEAFGPEGRRLYLQRCASCHALYRPESQQPGAWPKIVRDMTARSKLTDATARDITRYLVVAAGAPR